MTGAIRGTAGRQADQATVSSPKAMISGDDDSWRQPRPICSNFIAEADLSPLRRRIRPPT